MKNIFITGATGHLGMEITRCLLTTDIDKVFALVRDASALTVADERVVAVKGDITKSDLGLSAETVAMLRQQSITHVVHCAAETSIKKSRHELWEINVRGTENVVRTIGAICGEECRFAYISTAYVAGRQSGVIMEDAPLAKRFYTHYEESKAEAEMIVRNSRLPWIILRPGMIVGHSKTGFTRNFNTVYYVLKQLLQGKMHILPVSSRQTVNIIPVDYVAQKTVELLFNPDVTGKTFHLTMPHEALPTVGELVDATCQWAETNLNVHIGKPRCIPLPMLSKIGALCNIRGIRHNSMLGNILALMPYFCDEHIFDRTNTASLPPKGEEPDWRWQQWLPSMLEFACRHNFMQITNRSIFEQAMIRRASRHYPITYYNIRAHEIEQVSGDEMNTLVRQIAGILLSYNIKPGDRIAVTGINCTEQAAIDCAIGLVGAVSVPIYYTAPAKEVEDLLQRSGASLFFVGDERMMGQLKDVDLDISVITFANVVTTSGHTQSLQSLLKSPTAHEGGAKVYKGSALATIRYTSGTTGDPKGVMFLFDQLKWMGEVLTNLLPWNDRNKEMRYLSFLPMSHVVEGILASYAPYCMLCRVKFYYLNDFAMLTKALPKVRPTVFFSVPRFYEKLWGQIENNPLGWRYIGMDDGVLRRIVGFILRKAVLRKAGLNRCSQLIVGSAPMSEALLQKFRQLGIEIHNAYGQTEAPLITINRLGNNRIPSIGTPLPETTIRVADDGELIVDGPQVAMGYYHLDSDTFADGVLHTGDLGETDADGFVFIRGRKKDMLITSYGKNINCSKVEQRLTDIDCVTNAVLVGEQRPYCTALLWAEGDTSGLQEAIDEMNKTLSHPEQVKRWCVVEKPLSIKNGELTPNLKVRRNIVWEHFRKEADALYE